MTFETTRWTLVRAAQGDSNEAKEALSKLCNTYWRPAYVYVRGKGNSPEESKDLTQEFFLRLIENNFFLQVRQDRGKFRTFLLVAMNHFLINEWRKDGAVKRGGNFQFASLDHIQTAEANWQSTSSNLTPEEAYERQWAITLLDSALERLAKGQQSPEQQVRFQHLRPYLTVDETRLPYAELSSTLEMSEGAVKTAVHRLRKHFGEAIRTEIAETISDDTDIESELAHLMAALSSGR